MDFVQNFLALKPEIIFKVAEAEVSLKSEGTNNTPTVTLIILTAIFVGVLILMMLFVGGICHVCKSSPQAEQSTGPNVTEQTTVV